MPIRCIFLVISKCMEQENRYIYHFLSLRKEDSTLLNKLVEFLSSVRLTLLFLMIKSDILLYFYLFGSSLM